MTETVFIYRLGSLGDTVVALPCFNKIAATYPDARRIVLTNFPVSQKAAPLESILGESGLIHGAVRYPVGTRDPMKILSLGLRIRAARPHTVVYLGGGRGGAAVHRDMLFFKACGVRHIVGAPTTRDLERGGVDEMGVEEPEAERLARCLAELGPIDLNDRAAWDLHLTEAERDKGALVLTPLGGAPFIAVNTGGKVASKDWGEANWARLLSGLCASARLGLVFVGAAEDSERAARLAAVWPGPVVDGCGKLSPRESAAVLRRASLFVGHDSGPLHLAAAGGAPCVGIFGVGNQPRKWHPYGAGHRVLHDTRGVEFIDVPTVQAAVEDLLGGYARAEA